MKPDILFRMNTPVGEPLEIPVHDFGPKERAPKLVLVAGIHGNELNGIFVLARLADQLNKWSELKKRFLERVMIIPAVNVLGLHIRTRTWPVDRTDINRMFPGYSGGETTQRIAAALFASTRNAEVRIDIHASNSEFEELPQVRLYGSDDEERRIAELLGLPAIIECPMNNISTVTLLHAWKKSGGQNLVIQAGVADNLQMHHCDRLLHALRRLLVRLDILPADFLESAEEENDGDPAIYFPLHRTVTLISKKAGLFVPRLDVGRSVEKGTVLGTVYDGFDGGVRARIKAPQAGLLTGLRYQALLYEGDLLARIQVNTEVAEGADTYLIGQGQ